MFLRCSWSLLSRFIVSSELSLLNLTSCTNYSRIFSRYDKWSLVINPAISNKSEQQKHVHSTTLTNDVWTLRTFKNYKMKTLSQKNSILITLILSQWMNQAYFLLIILKLWLWLHIFFFFRYINLDNGNYVYWNVDQ